MKRIYSGLLTWLQNQRLTQAKCPRSFHEFAADPTISLAGSIRWRGERARLGATHRATLSARPAPIHSRPKTLAPGNQHIGSEPFGVVPRSIIWLFMRPFLVQAGVQLTNWGKYLN